MKYNQDIVFTILFLFLLSAFSFGASAATPQQWLRKHNKVRNTVRSPHLKWDRRLSKLAQNWANKLAKEAAVKKGCVAYHRKKTYKFSFCKPWGCGENIACNAYRSAPSPTLSIDMFVNSEKRYFNPVKSRCVGGVCGHYLAVISMISKKVGCAHADFMSGTTKYWISVCNFHDIGIKPEPNAKGAYSKLYPGQKCPWCNRKKLKAGDQYLFQGRCATIVKVRGGQVTFRMGGGQGTYPRAFFKKPCGKTAKAKPRAVKSRAAKPRAVKPRVAKPRVVKHRVAKSRRVGVMLPLAPGVLVRKQPRRRANGSLRIRWFEGSKQSLAFRGGREGGRSLFVCRARYQGGWHPGKAFLVGRKMICNIGWGGKEVTRKGGFQILRKGAYRYAGKIDLKKAIVGGKERAIRLYLCRARYRGGWHSGKAFRAGRGVVCNIGWGGREVVVKRGFQLLYHR